MRIHLLMATAALALCAGSAQAEFSLHVLHINDFHSRIEPINKFDSTCTEKDASEDGCFGGVARVKAQLGRLVPVHRVVDLSVRAEELGQDRPLARELALIKVAGTGDARVEALRLAEAFRAKVIDANTGHFIFEITGAVAKIEQFIGIMAPLGLVEVCRTGVAAMNRGAQGM